MLLCSRRIFGAHSIDLTLHYVSSLRTQKLGFNFRSESVFELQIQYESVQRHGIDPSATYSVSGPVELISRAELPPLELRSRPKFSFRSSAGLQEEN